MKLRDVGEDRLLQQLLPHLHRHSGVLLGAGDDCAIVRSPKRGLLQVLKTDCLVEGIHFLAETEAKLVGWKAMARPLSDFAAMSAVPEFALVTLVVPSATRVAWVKQLYRGLEKIAGLFAVTIVGGETSGTKGPAVISVAITGSVEKERWVGRSGGKADDVLFVTGRLGGSITGRHLRFTPRIAESRWLTEHFRVHAMMDLSDGLGTDLPRMAEASKVGFRIEPEMLPLNRGVSTDEAISDGEDYELLFALAPKDSALLQRRWRKHFPKVPLTRIGELTRKPKIENRKLSRGYLHFG
ncbi:MAG TPA: thiamine-phosphate kinase [Chthoniobacterales bacterium]|nr:thiamine-phosphate kinase [Chthoniobacterales bacterium]